MFCIITLPFMNMKTFMKFLMVWNGSSDLETLSGYSVYYFIKYMYMCTTLHQRMSHHTHVVRSKIKTSHTEFTEAHDYTDNLRPWVLSSNHLWTRLEYCLGLARVSCNEGHLDGAFISDWMYGITVERTTLLLSQNMSIRSFDRGLHM